MSAIAGAYSRRGAPVDRAVLGRLSRGLEHMGPDGECFAVAPCIGMVFRPFDTHGESHEVSQPLVTREGYMLCFDGRLDNAPEIAGRLPDGVGATEPEIVLGACRRWGLEALASLVGDFALALWDPQERRLMLASDGMGRRPLYYRSTADGVLWASRGRTLAAAAGLSPEPDEEYVADFLTNRPSTRGPFRGIRVVPGGHALVVSHDSEELKRYWEFDPHHQIHHPRDEDYAAQFAEIFQRAVECRLRSSGPVFCELSGGLDSSAIACVADGLVKGGRVGPKAVHTVSHVFDQSASSDETDFIDRVEAHLGRRGLHVRETECPPLEPLPASFLPDHPSNGLCFVARSNRVVREMRRAGSRVLLSGMGGDQLFLSQPDVALPLGDLLAEGKIIEAFRFCGEWSRLRKLSFAATLWSGFQRLLDRRRKSAAPLDGVKLGEWFDAAFAARTALEERLGSTDRERAIDGSSRAEQRAYVQRAVRLFAMEPCTSEGYVDVRYPFLDRRLAELALAMPLDQKVRAGESRYVVRRGLAGRVPRDVLDRRTKSGPGEAFYRALVREWPRLSPMLADPRVSAYGFVDRRSFLAALQRARHGLATNQTHVIRTLSLEFWLRTLDEGPSRSVLRGQSPCRPAGGESSSRKGRKPWTTRRPTSSPRCWSWAAPRP